MMEMKYSKEFMKRFGAKLVAAIKKRAPVDTGSLRADVVYDITETKDGLVFLITVDDHIAPANSDVPPSEYGLYLDQGSMYMRRTNPMSGQPTQGWMTDPVPGLTPEIFTKGLSDAMQRDIVEETLRQLKD